MGSLERYRGVHGVSERFKGTSGAARGFKRVSVYSRMFHGCFMGDHRVSERLQGLSRDFKKIKGPGDYRNISGFKCFRDVSVNSR